MTVLSSPPRRATCAACLRAQSACICHWVRPLSSRVDLLILQHPLEVRNAKNSARLLHLCVAGSRLEVGEAFDGAAYVGEQKWVGQILQSWLEEARNRIGFAETAVQQALGEKSGDLQLLREKCRERGLGRGDGPAAFHRGVEGTEETNHG